MWKAHPAYYQSTRLYQWMKELQFDCYEDFYEQSIRDVEWFWNQAEEKIQFHWEKKYEQVLDVSKGWAFPTWYKGGICNAVATTLVKWATHPQTENNQALCFENEEGKQETYTYKELLQQVKQVSNGLKKEGLQKGDRVILYMPFIPENIISFLSVMYCGAISVPVFSGFGRDALTSRIIGCEASFILTSATMIRKGKTINMLHTVEECLPHCPSIQKVIVQGEVVCAHEKVIQWKQLCQYEGDFPYEKMNSNDPFMLIYTSGTTGKPKATVHIHSGFPIKAAVDGAFVLDIRQGDKVCWITDMGWMMGPFLVFATLINGATMVLYDGAIDYRNHLYLWDFIQKQQLTHIGVSPTLIRSLMAKTKEELCYPLSSLRVFASTGEPWNPSSWEWLFQEVGKSKMPIINYSGGTEIAGGILGNVLVKDITSATFNAPLLGMAAEVRSESESKVIGEVGELCLTKPWVGMTNSFWQDDSRYLATYWHKIKDVWVHGDWVYTDGVYWTITGRSDDTLNIGGKRVGPIDYESIIATHPFVIECGTVGIPHPIKGEVACCFVVRQQNECSDEQLEKELRSLLTKELGKALLPEYLYFIPDLPKTRNGKVMRRMMKHAYLKQGYGDTSSLVNGEVLVYIEQLGNKE